MSKKTKKTHEFSPVHGQMPSVNNIVCKDCLYRNKTEIKTGNKILRVGVVKSFCHKYPEPSGKPHNVLFLNEECPEYKMDASLYDEEGEKLY